MGSSNMNGWVSKWVKKNYPIAKSDLCTCFFNRAQQLAKDDGYISMITASSWMFISSFEKFRKQLLSEGSICSMIQQSTHGYAGVTVPTTMFTYACHRMGVIGSYIRLEDFDRPQWQEPRALEALADPGCGWFYRADADGFGAIPGSPIAYWASGAIRSAFRSMDSLGKRLITREGMATADNDRFVKEWFECSLSRIEFHQCAGEPTKRKWYPYEKGGDYRKWYGNRELVVDWEDDGFGILHNYDKKTGRLRSHNYNGLFAFKRGLTWSSISSALIHVRWSPDGELFDSKGAKGFTEDDESAYYAMALINSSFATEVLRVLAPTIDFKVGDIIELPDANSSVARIADIAKRNISLGQSDWDAFEVSWDFRRHPLL